MLLQDTVYFTNELKTNKSVQQRWRDLELYVADSYKVTPRVTVDFGLRFSHLEPPWMADDQQANFVLSTVDPALGNSPCNGMQYPPGTNPCPGLGLEGGDRRPHPESRARPVPLGRAASRGRLERLRRRQDGHPRRRGPLLRA